MKKNQLLKNTPLLGVYLKNNIKLEEHHGWQVANFFKSQSEEKKQLEKASVLADWSFIGKFHLKGAKASQMVNKIVAGASKIKNGTAFVKSNICILKLLADKYLFYALQKKKHKLKTNLSKKRQIILMLAVL